MNIFYGDILCLLGSITMLAFAGWITIATIRSTNPNSLTLSKSTIATSLGFGLPWIPFALYLFQSPYEVTEMSRFPTMHNWAMALLSLSMSLFFLSFIFFGVLEKNAPKKKVINKN